MKAPIIMVPAAIGISALLKKKKNAAGTENPRGARIFQDTLRFRCVGEMFGIRFASQPNATTAAMQPAMASTPGSYGKAKKPRIIARTNSPWKRTRIFDESQIRVLDCGYVSSTRKMGIVMLKIAW